MNTKGIVTSQYLAALKMLKEVISKCPLSVWDAPQDKDRFWYRAHHALYWAERDLRAAWGVTERWNGPRRPDETAPVTKREMLGYLEFIQKYSDPGAHRARALPRKVRPFRSERLEVVIAGIRHIQQHTGELYERLGSRKRVKLYWTEHVRRKHL